MRGEVTGAPSGASILGSIRSSLQKWIEADKVNEEYDLSYQVCQYISKCTQYFTECHVSKLRFCSDTLKESHLSFQLIR